MADRDPFATAPDLASARVAQHLVAARAEIDAAFGEGYAGDNPELVAAFLQASAIESAVASGQVATGDALKAAQQISRELQETLLKLKPRFFG